ncbi:fibronectin type III domain-containing protein [Flavobacterium sp. N2270]|uniref:fibronectin type III domain-containing protein n=1 Tax=Flavobacterium sp. N2270 TaxID=2986831 RepID=UPI0022255883|nr:fibronectin type III domain-containing protein [Flavobacterium sp. N2270]
MKNYFFKTILLSFFFIVATSCDSDDSNQVDAPTVSSDTTAGNVEATYTTIKINGNVTSTGGGEITSRGVCWSTSLNPTINDNRTSETANVFSSTISNLTANTAYNFRVYATNSAGTSYGINQNYSTSSLDASMWNFLINNSGSSWNADVTFNADGTTVYDEPSDPGTYLTNGTWSLNGNILTYDMDSSEPTNASYQFTGTLLNSTMSGTFTWSGSPDQTWSAIEY